MKPFKKLGTLTGAAILTMAMLTGCVQTEEIVDNSPEQSVNTEESNVEAEESNVPEELYTVDEDGIYTFNTDLFDPEKFSGTIYIHDQAVSLPLTHENLNAANIYVGSSNWFEDGTDYATHLAEKIVEAGDDEKYGLFYKVEGSAAERCEDYGSMFVYNYSTQDLPMSECQIGRYDTCISTSFSAQKEAAWKMFYGEEEGAKRSENDFNVDVVMEILGAPAVAATDGMYLIYPYEDYVIMVGNYYAGNCDLVWIYSWECFLDESDFGKPYESDWLSAIPEEYRYGHY